MSEDHKRRDWCFTAWRKPNPEAIAENPGVTYLIIGKEKCPTTGKKHYQCYIRFTNARKFKSVKKILGDNEAHIEPCRGTPAQNILYCKKEGKYKEYGEPPSQGSRSDLFDIRAALTSGMSIRDIIEMGEIRNNQQLKFAENLLKYIRPQPRDPPEVHWLWGETGTGKTRRVYELEPDVYVVPMNFDWFDGYVGQEAVLFDEFRAQIPMYQVLRLLDRYPMNVPVKGSFTPWVPKRIYITSCAPPQHYYRARKAFDNNDQFIRRITTVTELRPENFKPPFEE